MTWEIKVLHEFEREFRDKIVEELCDRLEEDEIDPYDEDAVNEAAWNEIHDVVDGWFVYNVDQLAALVYYGHINDGMDGCWDDIYEDIVENACQRYSEDKDE